MKIGIIDADLIGRNKHRFPNLACMKISSYYKAMGYEVTLLTSYSTISEYDKVFLSKVFTDTPYPEIVLNLPNVEYGGTGFYFDKAPNLPDEIEHSKPDYTLYNEWVKSQLDAGVKPVSLKAYTDYSIGFITRGCFRKCGFCVNKKYNHVFTHSPLAEFYDHTRKKICLLDDNFLGCKEWRSLLEELIATGKPFKFKQGLDERLLTAEKLKLLLSSKYDGYITFAFDSIKDYELIEKKLQLIRSQTNRDIFTFYVLCGYESTDINDIENTFKRIQLLQRYKCLPYIMRYQSETDKPYIKSEFKSIYVSLARWCNQPSIFKKMSFYEFCNARSDTRKYIDDFINKYPDKANKYIYSKWGDLC